MNKKLIFLVATIMVLSFAGFAFAATMTDLNDASWAKDKIEKWVTSGIIKGYEDNSFRPNKSVTRAEFVAMVNRAFDKKDATATASFKDVKSTDWYYADVATAKKEGYISGYENNTFQPNKSITREEAATIVAKLLKLAKAGTVDGFTDKDGIQSWAKDYVASVVDKKIMQGYENKSFKPTSNITRAESVETLYKALEVKNGVVVSSSGGGGGATTVAVTGVTLDKATATLAIGETVSLIATIAPSNASNKNVTWTTSDANIANVSDGTVTAVNPGVATITVTSNNGKTATFLVTITSLPIPNGFEALDGDPVIFVDPITESTFAVISIKAEYANKIQSISVFGVPVNKAPDGKYRAVVADGTTLESLLANLVIILKDAPNFNWPEAIDGEPVVYIDPITESTFAVISIKPAFVNKVESITVFGAQVNKAPDGKYRTVIPEGTTIDDLKGNIEVILKQIGPVITRAVALLGAFGDTTVYVTIGEGNELQSVTANGNPLTYNASLGKWTETYFNYQENDIIEVLVTLADGTTDSQSVSVVK